MTNFPNLADVAVTLALVAAGFSESLIRLIERLC